MFNMHAVATHSVKRWFANDNMTSYCDITNDIYPVTITTICHCSILEFFKGAYNQASHSGHHQTSARHCHRYSILAVTVHRYLHAVQ